MPDKKSNPILLLTGFEPFGAFHENPSWHAASSARENLDGLVAARLLPVDHLEARRRLMAALEELNPVACLCMGLAPGEEFRLEEIARKPNEFAGIAGPQQLQGTWPWQAAERVLNLNEIPHRRSIDAGAYVCESTYWTLLEFASRHASLMHAGFLHVPAIDPRFPAQKTAEVVHLIVSSYCSSYLKKE